MAIEIKLPELGDGIESGDVIDVFVSVGDTIKADQSLLELETDKATVEVPSTHAGTVTKIHVSAGDTISIGATILSIDEVATSPAPAPAATPEPVAEAAPPAAPAPAQTAPTPTPATAPPVPTATPTPPATSTPPAAPAPTPVAAPVAKVPPAATPNEDGSLAPAGPAIRRLAREVGVDLAQVVGTGPGGRISRDDILSIVRHGGTRPRAPQVAVAAPVEEASPAVAPPTPATPKGADDWGPVQTEPISRMRKTIASKMHESWTSVPRVTNFDDADVTDLEDMRQASKSDYAARGIKLTQMPFLIKSVAMSLKNNPSINATFDEDNQQIIYKKYVNVGIAVDTDRGLVVPALRNADQLSIPEIARSLGAMAETARKNEFKIEDLRGGTFTISNLGAIGGTYSTPIVNVPEVAILLVGRSRKMPVVIGNEIKIRLMMPLSLSYDHKLVDGATAARFLNDVIAYLEAPSRLLIAP